MGKHKDSDAHMARQAYAEALEALQVGLSRMQRRLIDRQAKLLVIIEGRDAAGKDGTIKRIVEHMSPRDTRVVALPTPSEHDKRAWYFQRWCAHLPVAGEFVAFNRSWYNRAGVERVMGFCTEAELAEFYATVPLFEQLLAHSGMSVLKYYLDISREEQAKRLKKRAEDPLKQWKISAIDEAAQGKWDDYSAARDDMLARTHSVFAPWTIIRADDKPTARLALIRDLLARCGEILGENDWLDHARDLALPDPTHAFLYDAAALEKGWLAR